MIHTKLDPAVFETSAGTSGIPIVPLVDPVSTDGGMGAIPLHETVRAVAPAGHASATGAPGFRQAAGDQVTTIAAAGADHADVHSDLHTTVSTFADLDAAIQTADDTSSGDVTITISGTITESHDLYAINLQSGVSLTIDTTGGGGTLDGDGLYRGLFVYQGDVTVQDLTIDDAAAIGGNGASGGAGGAGLGGGLFVAGTTAGAGTGGNVTLDDVVFTGDSAAGGAGSVNTGRGAGGRTAMRAGIFMRRKAGFAR